MLGEPCKLRVRTDTGKDPGIALGEGASTLALQRTGDDYGPAARGTGVDDLVNEVDDLVWKPNSNLPAHPKMVPKW